MAICLLYLILLLLIKVDLGFSQTCVKKVDPPYRHYTEIGCKPIFKNNCIERYDCPLFKKLLNTTQCYYKGEYYKINQSIPDNLPLPDCYVHCFCNKAVEDTRARFVCAVTSCAVVLPNPPEICLDQYTFANCCPEKQVCGQREIDALPTCTWNSTVYKEGQLFYPEQKCQKCICSKEYDGTIKAPWCREVECGIGLANEGELHDKCAPVYLDGSDKCCPTEWKCPAPIDKIVKKPVGAYAIKPAPDMKCYYGKQLLNVGDKVTGDKCITCSCDMPPLLSCTRQQNC